MQKCIKFSYDNQTIFTNLENKNTLKELANALNATIVTSRAAKKNIVSLKKLLRNINSAPKEQIMNNIDVDINSEINSYILNTFKKGEIVSTKLLKFRFRELSSQKINKYIKNVIKELENEKIKIKKVKNGHYST